jgi:hypothetical protein
VVVIVLVGLIVASLRIDREDVRQEAANLAFAEKAYQETHGHFTDDLSELRFAHNGRISVHVVASFDEFCVDAQYGALSAVSREADFTEEGQRVSVGSGHCDGQLNSTPERLGLADFVGEYLDPLSGTRLVISADGTFTLGDVTEGTVTVREIAGFQGEFAILQPREGDVASVKIWSQGVLLTAGTCAPSDSTCGQYFRKLS